jgi:hypothetical protein
MPEMAQIEKRKVTKDKIGWERFQFPIFSAIIFSGSTIRMSDAAPKSKAAWLVALVQLRSHRGWWAYLIWLLVYLFFAMMFAEEMGAHDGATATQGWPLLVPIVVVIVQWIRPTILGWAIICLSTLIYFGVGAYYMITENFGPHPQWKHDLGGVILGSLFLVVLLAVCIALIFAARPRAFLETHVV